MLIYEESFKQLGIVIYAGTCTQKDNDLGFWQLLLQEMNQEHYFLESILHDYVGIMQAFRNNIAFGLLNSVLILRRIIRIDCF